MMPHVELLSARIVSFHVLLGRAIQSGKLEAFESSKLLLTLLKCDRTFVLNMAQWIHMGQNKITFKINFAGQFWKFPFNYIKFCKWFEYLFFDISGFSCNSIGCCLLKWFSLCVTIVFVVYVDPFRVCDDNGNDGGGDGIRFIWLLSFASSLLLAWWLLLMLLALLLFNR